jgi:Sigma-70 region 2
LISQSKLFTSFLNGKKALKADFEQVAIPHLSYIYTAALYLTKDEHEAEDLVQETYLRAYRFFHKFEPGTNSRGQSTYRRANSRLASIDPRVSPGLPMIRPPTTYILLRRSAAMALSVALPAFRPFSRWAFLEWYEPSI